jgi:23S rRNA (uridine2552-2'-O)-methyltransferase
VTLDKVQLPRKLHAKNHSKKKRSNSSHRWISRHINDPYVALAQDLGYRSRAAFKLIEINDKFNLLARNVRILDLGAAPGSWSQIAVAKTLPKTENQIIAVDLLPISPLKNVITIEGDINDDKVIDEIKQQHQKFDLIISDIAPNTVGHNQTDHLRIMAIADSVFELVLELLAENGSLVIKLFQGELQQEFFLALRKLFKKVHYFKPTSSRKESSEIYIIAKEYLNDQAQL